MLYVSIYLCWTSGFYFYSLRPVALTSIVQLRTTGTIPLRTTGMRLYQWLSLVLLLAVLTGLIPVVLTGRVSGQWFSTGMIPVVFTGIRTHIRLVIKSRPKNTYIIYLYCSNSQCPPGRKKNQVNKKLNNLAETHEVTFKQVIASALF